MLAHRPAIKQSHLARLTRLGWSQERDDRVAALHREGLEPIDIALKIGAPVASVRGIVGRLLLHRVIEPRQPRRLG